MVDLFVCLSASDLSLWERIAEWYQNSLLRELINHFAQRYFKIEFGAYENFSVGDGLGSTLTGIVLALTVGMIVAALMTARTRNGLGSFVRKLISEGCLSADSAKTLFELGYFRSPMIRRELARGSILRMVVRCRENDPDEKDGGEAAADVGCDGEKTEEPDAKTPEKNIYVPQNTAKIDFTSAHFYIPEDLRVRAEIRFENKGSSWQMTALTCVGIVIVAGLLCYFLPDVVAFVDNLITFVAP